MKTTVAALALAVAVAQPQMHHVLETHDHLYRVRILPDFDSRSVPHFVGCIEFEDISGNKYICGFSLIFYKGHSSWLGLIGSPSGTITSTAKTRSLRQFRHEAANAARAHNGAAP